MWEIVQTNTYKAVSSLVSKDVPRFDEVYAAVEWALLRNPESYPTVEERRSLRQIKTRAFGDTPAMRFLYVCRGNKVTLRYVEAMDEPDGGGLRQMLPEGGCDANRRRDGRASDSPVAGGGAPRRLPLAAAL